MAGEDRTEAATPRRLQRAREEGHVAVSREVPALAGLTAASVILAMAGPALGTNLVARLGGMLALPPRVDVPSALLACCMAAAACAGPILLGLLAASLVGSALQTGLVLNPGALRPNFGRLNPAGGLKRLFGPTGLAEAAKTLVKFAILGVAVFHVLSGNLAGLRSGVLWQPGQWSSRIYDIVLQLTETLLGAQLVIAGADVVWVRHRHAQQLRMTKQEVRQDAKDADGNPQVKGRLRQIRLARTRKRMMAAVPTATVVVTNPTHYAVALAYDRNQNAAPRVVAKGVDEVAARIRDVAAEHRVPLVANPPLARALFKVDVDAEIPPEHFKVVAEVIAYVWRLRTRAALH